jgi:hypothetical protein
MAANYTATLGKGKEKGDVVFSNGGTSTPAITVIVNTNRVSTPDEAVRLLEKIGLRILEKNHPAA